MCVSVGYMLVEIHVAKAVGGTVVHAPVLIILRPWTFLRVVATVSLLINVLYSSAIPYVHFVLCVLCYYLRIWKSYPWCNATCGVLLYPSFSCALARHCYALVGRVKENLPSDVHEPGTRAECTLCIHIHAQVSYVLYH